MKEAFRTIGVAIVCTTLIVGALLFTGIVQIHTTPSITEGGDSPTQEYPQEGDTEGSPGDGDSTVEETTIMPIPSILPSVPAPEIERQIVPEESEEGTTYPLPKPVSPRIGSYGLLPATGISVVHERDEKRNMVRYDNCTVAFSLPDKKQGAWAITAGHCGNAGQKVYSQPKGETFASSHYLGTIVYSSRADAKGGTLDWGAIKLSSSAYHPKHSTRIPLRLDTTPRKKGVKVCKRGSTTGFNCGTQGDSHVLTQLRDSGDSVTVADMSQAQLCALPGDSGAPVYDRKGIIGIVSSTSASASDIKRRKCSDGTVAYYTPIADVIAAIEKSVPDINLEYSY